MLRRSSSDLGKLLLRLSVGAVLLYFGVNALREPELQGALWVTPVIADLLTTFIPLKTFMLVLGGLQVLASAGIVLGIAFRFASGLAALLVLGIVINLGSVAVNDTVYRDLVILAATLVLFMEGPGRYALRR